MSESDPMWSPRELADYLGMSVNTVNYWRYTGTGPRFIRCGRHVRYRESDVQSWMEANSEDNTAGELLQ